MITERLISISVQGGAEIARPDIARPDKAAPYRPNIVINNQLAQVVEDIYTNIGIGFSG